MCIIFEQHTNVTRFGLLERFGVSSRIVSNSKALAIVTGVPKAGSFDDNTRFMEGDLTELLRHKDKDIDETVLEFQSNSDYVSFVIYVYSKSFEDFEGMTSNNYVRLLFTSYNSESQYWLVSGMVDKRAAKAFIQALKDLHVHVGNLNHLDFLD